MEKGKLYVVGTPIGNLEDMTLRAIRILKEVDLILCEDTRTTGVLLSHYEIKTPTISYHTKSSIKKANEIIEKLDSGMNLALVSDAGTPGISDPGSLLISKAHESGIKVLPIPGPSALISALSISGFTGGNFVFEGFLPHKKGREKLFKKMAESKETHVFYESPHRIIKTLDSLAKLMPERQIMLGRELTKRFEETIKGTPKEVIQVLEGNTEKIRGEFVGIIFS